MAIDWEGLLGDDVDLQEAYDDMVMDAYLTMAEQDCPPPKAPGSKETPSSDDNSPKADPSQAGKPSDDASPASADSCPPAWDISRTRFPVISAVLLSCCSMRSSAAILSRDTPAPPGALFWGWPSCPPSAGSSYSTCC